MRIFVFLMIFLGLLCPESGFAASFDCEKAETATEKLICSDGALSELDTSMDRAYKKAVVSATNPGKLEKEQRYWLGNRRAACKDVACLKQAYAGRLKELNPSGSQGSSSDGMQFKYGGEIRVRVNSSSGF